MVCLYCGSQSMRVVNSRSKIRGALVWRRRLCGSCGALLTTFESYDLESALLVKKRSGALESFQRDKLLISIARAIEHKPNTSQAASHLVQNVIQAILKTRPMPKILSSKDISHMTNLVLKRYDAASSVRYLSFQAPTSTKRDINDMLAE